MKEMQQPLIGCVPSRRWRPPSVPYAHELHRALPEAPVADGGNCGVEEGSHESFIERRALSFRAQTTLWIAQRASAAVLALCVVAHLITIIYAVRNGLSAAEILGRTRGNVAWFAFYSLFVLAVTIHAPIGLRTVLGEWLRWRGASREVFLLLFAAALAWTGMHAVLAVFS